MVNKSIKEIETMITFLFFHKIEITADLTPLEDLYINQYLIKKKQFDNFLD